MKSRSIYTAAIVMGLACIPLVMLASPARADSLPNFLWLTSEDNGPHLGCYGDQYAKTPNLDALAQRGMLFLHASSNAPVCAPARTTIISGVYPPALGAQHMRSMIEMPPFMKMYPQYLREKGYYCTNNSKEDYNLVKPDGVWDDSSRKGHWRNREEGQPFFAIFNFTTTHESQIRNAISEDLQIHDPDEAPVPAYHPDRPEVRQNWAQYYDRITQMDAQCGKVLEQLKADGLADDTIVFYYGDHGSGMPRSKRWPYNSGIHVPMIVFIPEKFRHLAPPEYAPGAESDRLVAFVDLAPTLLSAVGIEPPEWMQGHAFLGPHQAPKPDYSYGFRGRMDERYDMVRSLRDQRYMYIRNYMPHKIYGQYLHYMFQTQTTQVWHRLYQEGKLEPPKTYFWEAKPAEELYDLEADPDEVVNLADSPEHQEVLQRMRSALYDWQYRIRDLGFLPEAQLHARAANTTPYEMGHDPAKYPLDRIAPAAQLASSLDPADTRRVVELASADDPAIRFWAALGLRMRGEAVVQQHLGTLRRLLADDDPSVQLAAAEPLGMWGTDNDVQKAFDVVALYADPAENGVYLGMQALNALDQFDQRAKRVLGDRVHDLVTSIAKFDPDANGRLKNYCDRLIGAITADVE